MGISKARANGTGMECTWALDQNPEACQTFGANLPGKVICSGIEKVDFSCLEAVDGMAFGFPCNDFSQVGERLGRNGYFGGLYAYAVTALKLLKPLFFLAENVDGLRSTNSTQDYQHILAELRNAGYIIFPRLYRLEEYGVPQARRRVFIVGFRKDLGIEGFNPPNPGKKIVSCREALEKPMRPDVPNNERTRQSPVVIERLRYIKPGENAFSAKLPPRLRLNVKGAKISQIYRRLDPDKPAYTVTGCGGGGTHMYHWKEHRALTNRERARLQTFPDQFEFIGTKEGVRAQIGMAVPPEFAKKISSAILRHLIFRGVKPAK